LPSFIASGAIKRKINIFSESEAQQEVKKTQNFGAQILTFYDEKYPKILRQIPDPAPILTIKGDTDFFERDIIAIVGPRNASFGAINWTKKIALELGQNSVIIASGLARGADAAAHEASILSGTIAVIAGGIDHIYPPENQQLYQQIAKLGLLVSESAFGAPPKGGNFVQRNRIISGISFGVVVVEAGLKSGSLITAKYAMAQGREVFAIPGSPFDPRCHGVNRLIKDGAKMFESVDDILAELPKMRAHFRQSNLLREPDSQAFEAPLPKMPNDQEIAQIRHEILTRTSFAPVAIETIIEQLQLPARFVNIALVQLELDDKIEVNFGEVVLKN
jgi:DNA processing protein